MGSIFSQIMTTVVCETSRSYQRLLKSKKKIGGNHAFFRDNCASIILWRKTLNRHFSEKIMIKGYFPPNFRVYTRTGTNAMIIVMFKVSKYISNKW